MANKNTNPGGSKTAGSGVMHSPEASRAHTRTRVVSPTGILKESLIDLPGARVHTHARVRTREREHRLRRMARENVRRRFRSCA